LVFGSRTGLHHADWTDGDVRGFIDHVQSEQPYADGWTAYAEKFRTRLYPGPAEAAERDEGAGQLAF